jgi:hypothetical protein
MADTLETEGAADPDGELAVLDGLADAVEENARDERRLARRIRRLRVGRAAGRTWHDLVTGERQPGVLTLASRILNRLTETSGGLRRVIAHGLRLEGATIAAIAALFGVSHQRVSALLHRRNHPPSI